MKIAQSFTAPLILGLTGWVSFAGFAGAAEHDAMQGMSHDAMQPGHQMPDPAAMHTMPAGHMDAAQKPSEPGQGAFAAISEIAAMLAADPDTDWALVDITALRDHLRDMDMLVTETQVSAVPVPAGLQNTISTGEPNGAAALRMVPAHGPVLAAETGWLSDLQTTENQLIWTVTSPTDSDRIRALGFFGLMATGDHHRQHHLAIARGEPVHGMADQN